MLGSSLIEEWIRKLDASMESKSASQYRQFPRTALLWLLGSLVLVYIPLQISTPIWLAGVMLFVILWRWMMHVGRWPLPNTAAKVVVVVLGIAAVLASSGGRFHLESATTFILVAALLKTLEIKSQRDGYIIVFLGFFLLGIRFLFDQGILTAIYIICTVLVLISALIGMHHTSSQLSTKKALGLSFAMLSVSIPMMLIMFFLFPRLEPLWNLNLQSKGAKTGLSDRISAGDIARLSQSDELVFRVEFNGKVLPQQEWYWRGITLDEYEEGTWSVSGLHEGADWFPNSWQPPEKQDGIYSYSIIQEANPQRNWLYGLRGVAAVEVGIGMTSDDRIVNKEPLYQRKAYNVKSWPDVSISEQGLSNNERYVNLKIPNDENPKAVAWAEEIKQKVDDKTDQVEFVMKHFRDQPFYYTLEPPLMDGNEIDQFLFKHKRGFCAHYASSFVFLMRAMGIPSRMVAGYQGGEVNPETGVISVRQYHAHGWAEVWIEGEGWIRKDPTAQVAPDRILQGLEEAVKDEGTFLGGSVLSLHAYSDWPLLRSVQDALDDLNYEWHKTVLAYDRNKQSGFMQNVFGVDSYKKMLYWLGLGFVFVFFALAVILFYQKPRQRLDPMQRALQKMDRRLSKMGLERKVGEGLNDYGVRLISSFPNNKKAIERVVVQLQNYYFSPSGALDHHALRKSIEKLSRDLQKVGTSYKNNHPPQH